MIVDATSKTGRALPNVAIWACAGVTMAMNAKFGYSLGSDDFERWMYVAFGIALDVCKVMGLAFAAHHFFKGYWIKGTFATLVWAAAVTYSGTAALGFAAMTRSHVTGEQAYENDKITTARNEFNRYAKEVETYKKNPFYDHTHGCTREQNKMSGAQAWFCDQYAFKVKEMEKAKTDLPKKYVAPADPQMLFFASLTGKSKDEMLKMWAMMIAVIAELAASVGTYAFSASRAKPVRTTRSAPKLTVVQPTNVNGEQKRRPGRPKGSKNKPKLELVSNG
jgi:hypothetical protein